jgi:hypothetical protein
MFDSGSWLLPRTVLWKFLCGMQDFVMLHVLVEPNILSFWSIALLRVLNWFRCTGTNSDHEFRSYALTVGCYVSMICQLLGSEGVVVSSSSLRSRLWEQCRVKSDLALEMFLADVASST